MTTTTTKKPISEKTRAKALKTFDGMREIVKNEMLVAGNYVTRIVNRELAEKGSLCGGRKFCGIGAGLVAYGIGPGFGATEDDPIDRDARLLWSRAVSAWQWPEYNADIYKGRPALRVVRDVLEEVAEEYAGRMGIQITSREDCSTFESLIESGQGPFHNGHEGRPVLLRMIRSAERKVRAL